MRTTLLNSLLLLLLLGFTSKVSADQGDIVEFELLDEFDEEITVTFVKDQLSLYIDFSNPIIDLIFDAFLRGLVDDRNIKIYKIVYETIDFDDQPTQASGIVLIPEGPLRDCSLSMSLYGHGTDFYKYRVFSNPVYWSFEFLNPLLMAGINTITVAPDYFGMGDGPDFHYLNNYKTNSTSSLDMIRAARLLCDELDIDYNDKLLPTGYSEGGSNAFGVAKWIREQGLQDEFKIRFIGGGSGAYDLSGTTYDVVVNSDYYRYEEFILHTIEACQSLYGSFYDENAGEDISELLIPPYDELYEADIPTQNGFVFWSPYLWTDMFKPEFINAIRTESNHPLRSCLAENDIYDWANPYASYYYYCSGDEVIPPQNSIVARDAHRSYVPWWQFWNQFKYQAIDLGSAQFNDHFSCAIPTMLVQLLLMQGKLGAECTGRVNMDHEALMSIGGESLHAKFFHGQKDLVLKYNDDLSRSSITGIHLNTGEQFSIGAQNRSQSITENGLYLLLIQNDDGTSDISWFVKTDPNFVNTSNYDPLSYNSESNEISLDLSLLSENVEQVAVMDLDGNEWLVINSIESQERLQFMRPSSMPSGEYIVDVRSRHQNYPLLLTISDREIVTTNGVYPNPAISEIHLELESQFEDHAIVYEIHDMKGQLLEKMKSGQFNNVLSVPVNHLASGIYTLSVRSDQHVQHFTFLKE